MGAILGLGMGHYPGFLFDDATMADIPNRLKSGRIRPEFADPMTWPPEMRAEWGDDEGATFAAAHRAEFMESARKVRAAIDDFAPDAVVIFGEDRYEAFHEDVVPPFCVFAMDEVVARPFSWRRVGGPIRSSYWGDPPDYELRAPGAKELALTLAGGLIERGFDVAYAYRQPHGDAVAHSFANTLLFLDQDRTGFPYPVLPFHVNSYGTFMIRGGVEDRSILGASDPPPPPPWRAFALGEAIGEAILASDLRVACIGSSSWSHGLSVAAHGGLYPDVDADRARYEELRAGRYEAWSRLTTDDLLRAGETELLNWLPLVGAMRRADAGAPAYCVLHESYLMSSSKCTTIFAAVER